MDYIYNVRKIRPNKILKVEEGLYKNTLILGFEMDWLLNEKNNWLSNENKYYYFYIPGIVLKINEIKEDNRIIR